MLIGQKTFHDQKNNDLFSLSTEIFLQPALSANINPLLLIPLTGIITQTTLLAGKGRTVKKRSSTLGR